jgi:hypothetical protein
MTTFRQEVHEFVRASETLLSVGVSCVGNAAYMKRPAK